MITSYDTLPYDSWPFALTHPDHLAVVARLQGLRTPPIETARVLELGCASGGNLIPMAAAFPRAQFLGIDFSSRQIAAGQQTVGALGLHNIDLRAQSILDFAREEGAFDYLLCHGVYSWVPPPVQDRILAICAHHLAPFGVAYVSYNTLPGSYPRQMIRQILTFHTNSYADPREQVVQARALLDFLGRHVTAQPDSVYPGLVRGAAQIFQERSESYLKHDYLEEVNESLYFHQFLDRLAMHPLRYLGDAKVREMRPEAFPQEVQATLAHVTPDPLIREQYLDFLRNQPFRRSVLCRADAIVGPANEPVMIDDFHLVSVARGRGVPTASAAGAPPAATTPLRALILNDLDAIWPESVSFSNLVVRLEKAFAGTAVIDPSQVAAEIMDAFWHNQVEFHAWPLPCISRPGSHPRAFSVARHQAQRAPRVTNLRHELVDLDDAHRQFLHLLDGTRSQVELTSLVPDALMKLANLAREALLV